MRKLTIATSLLMLAPPVVANAQGPPQPPTQAPVACPQGQLSARGFVLSAADGHRFQISRGDGGHTRVVATAPQPATAFPQDTLFFRGVVPMTNRSPQGLVRLTYDKPLAQIFPLKVGARHVLEFVGQPQGKPSFTGRLEIEVLGEETLSIGGCIFRTLRLSRQSVFDNGRKTPVSLVNWVESLNAVVRSTQTEPDGQKEIAAPRFVFDSVTLR